MVETAKNFDRGDPTDAPNGSRKRRVLIERQMSPRRIVIRDVRWNYATQVNLAEHDEMVEALPPDRADQPFDVSVLPR